LLIVAIEQGDIFLNTSSCIRYTLNFDQLLSNDSTQSVTITPRPNTCSSKF